MNEFIRRFCEEPEFFNEVILCALCLFLGLWMTRKWKL